MSEYIIQSQYLLLVFTQFDNMICTHLFNRVVVDGDVVPAVPPFTNYVHMGTEVLIDGLGESGNIIINPSYVERQLMQKLKSSVMGHLLGAYKNGLVCVKEAAESCSDRKDPANNLHYNHKVKSIVQRDICKSIEIASSAMKFRGTYRSTSIFRLLPQVPADDDSDIDEFYDCNEHFA